MKKAVILCLVVLCMCLCLSGCSEYVDSFEKGYETGVERVKNNNGIFEIVAQDNVNDMTILRDTVTDVLYVRYTLMERGGLTVMLNADGTPLLYSEWCTLREASANGN